MYPEELTLTFDDAEANASRVTAAVAHAAAAELEDALGMIAHCVGQLSDDEVWRRSAEELNSVGNLLLHLTGNLQQWGVAGLSGAPDDRNRPGEFATRGGIAKDELLSELRSCVERARHTIRAVTPEELLRVRRVQGFAVSGMAALWHTVAHFRGHTQEIIGMTRQILGPRYRFAWTPRTKEEGA